MIYLVPDSEVATEPVECMDCGVVACVTPEYVEAHGNEDVLCSRCWAVNARAFRLKKLVEDHRPQTFDELKRGTTLKLFASPPKKKNLKR